MLIAGGENSKKIKFLISLTSMKSEKLSNALIGYYCIGVLPKLDRSNFRRAKLNLEKIDELMIQSKEFYYD